MITVHCALLHPEPIVDEMNTGVAGTGVQIAIFVADQDPHMTEVDDIGAGVLGQGIWMTIQTCQYLEGIQQTYQMFS